LKTLGGLHPVDVILRRSTVISADPLELRDDSTLGIPGLLQQARRHVAVAKHAGQRRLADGGHRAVSPRICRGLLDRGSEGAVVETWWCGDPVAREHVLGQPERDGAEARVSDRRVAPDLSASALGPAARDEDQGARARGAVAVGRAGARTAVDDADHRWRRAASRQLVLRSFLVARQAQGQGSRRANHREATGRPAATAIVGDYDVMPGALSLSAVSPTEREISMQRGRGQQRHLGVSGGPVSTFSLLRARAPDGVSRGGGDLPSRVADNLFWLGAIRARRRDRAARAHGERAAGRAARPESRPRGRARPAAGGAGRQQTHARPRAFVAPTDPQFLRSVERELLDAVFRDRSPGHAALRRSRPRTGRPGRARSDLDRHLAHPTSLQQGAAEMDAERSSGGSTLGTLATGLDRVIMRLQRWAAWSWRA